MYSDLVVIAFKHQDGARRVLDSLEIMRGKNLLGVETTALVARPDHAGREFRQTLEAPVGGMSDSKIILDRLIDLIFGGTGALKRIRKALGGTGFDMAFATELLETMQTYNSALCILVGSDSTGSARHMLNTLAQFEGKIYHTTLSIQAEAALLKS